MVNYLDGFATWTKCESSIRLLNANSIYEMKRGSENLAVRAFIGKL